MTTDLNDRIAVAKGWTRVVTGNQLAGVFIFWRNPEGKSAHRPDFTGTLEGVAELLSTLNSLPGKWWMWSVDAEGGTGTQYTQDNPAHCVQMDSSAPLYPPRFDSPRARPGDCVGEAWMGVFGKEAG